MQRLDRARLEGGEGQVEVVALGLQHLARSLGLRLALLRQVHVPPAGEAVLQIPLGLAVTEEDEGGHGMGSLCRRAG